MPVIEHPLQFRDLVEKARVAALQTYLTVPVAPAEPFITLVRMAAHLLRVPVSMITLIGRDQQWIKAAHGTDLQQLPRALAICNHAIAEPSGVMVVPDTLADPRFRSLPLVLAPPHIRFYAGVCLVDGDGFTLGTLCVMDDKPASIGRGALALLHEMAAETVEALARQRAEHAALQDNAAPVGPWRNEHPPHDSWNNSGWASRASFREPVAPPITGPAPVRSASPGWLGVRTEHAPLAGSDHAGRSLMSVAADSPAERAGLRVGDVILAIDDRAIRRRHDITAAVTACAVGGTIRLRVWRAGRVFERNIEIERDPKERLVQRRRS